MRTNHRVTGIVLRGETILLIHRFRHGEEYWVFPGGGVEEGETWEEALHREMLEETSLQLVDFQFLFESEQHPGFIFYQCELEPGEPRLGGPELAEQTPDNMHILEWVDINQLPNLSGLFPILDEQIFNETLFGDRQKNSK